MSRGPLKSCLSVTWECCHELRAVKRHMIARSGWLQWCLGNEHDWHKQRYLGLKEVPSLMTRICNQEVVCSSPARCPVPKTDLPRAERIFEVHATNQTTSTIRKLSRALWIVWCCNGLRLSSLFSPGAWGSEYGYSRVPSTDV